MGGISMHNHMAVNVQGIRHHQWMKWNVPHNTKAIKVLMLPGKYKFLKSLSSLNLIKSIRVVLRIRTKNDSICIVTTLNPKKSWMKNR